VELKNDKGEVSDFQRAMAAAELGAFLSWRYDLSLRQALNEEMERHGISDPVEVS
jgi:hypothetical protein